MYTSTHYKFSVTINYFPKESDYTKFKGDQKVVTYLHTF